MKEAKRKFRRWTLSAIDLKQAQTWISYLLDKDLYLEEEDEEKVVGRGLQTAAIVAYYRPFSGNWETSDTTAALGEEFLNTYNSKEKSLHQRIRRLRNQIYAHTDSEARDLKINVREIKDVPFAWASTHNPFPVMDKEVLERFLSMVEKLRAGVADKRIEVQDDLGAGDKF